MTLGAKIRAGILLWIAAEAIILIALIRTIGFPASVGLGLVGTVAGFLLLARSKRSAMEEVRLWASQGPRSQAAGVSFQLLGALLLILPGFVSDLFGIGLLIPAVQRAAARRFSAVFGSTGPHRRDGPLDLDPSEWRSERPDAPRLGPDR